MTQRAFSLTAGVIFLLIALLHVLRLLFAWKVTMGGLVIPTWASRVALVIAAYLAYEGFRLARKSPWKAAGMPCH